MINTENINRTLIPVGVAEPKDLEVQMVKWLMDDVPYDSTSRYQLVCLLEYI